MTVIIKKIISAFLVLAVAVISVPVISLAPVLAADRQGRLTYKKFGGNKRIRITYCDTAAVGAIKIPDTIEGLPVTEIGDSAFQGCAYITEITIPNSVTVIGTRAFYGCLSLDRVLVPKSVTNIDEYAFGYKAGKKNKPVLQDGFILYCYKNSAAHRYAVKNGINYRFVPTLETAAQSGLFVNTYTGIVFSETEKMTASSLIAQFKDTGTDTAVYKNGVRLSGEAFSGTGCEIRLTDGTLTLHTLTLAVRGDLNGDAVVDALDAFLCDSAVNGHIKLFGAYYAAANTDEVKPVLDVGDYSVLLNRTVGKTTSEK